MIENKAIFFTLEILQEKFLSIVMPVFHGKKKKKKKNKSRTIENENVSGNYNWGMKF